MTGVLTGDPNLSVTVEDLGDNQGANEEPLEDDEQYEEDSTTFSKPVKEILYLRLTRQLRSHLLQFSLLS